MRISETIALLQALQEEHGDVPVWQTVDAGIAPIGSVEYEAGDDFVPDRVLISEEC